MTIAEFVLLVQRRLRDDTGRQWRTEFVTEAVNAAFSALCHVVPQAYTEHRDLTLVEGTEQVIDSDLHRIIHLLHNKCPSTGKATRSIIKADLSVMDKVEPNWRQDDPRGHIIHYMLNAANEDTFYVWPPANAARPSPAPVEPIEPIAPSLPVFDINSLPTPPPPSVPVVFEPGVAPLPDYEMPVRVLSENGTGSFQQDYTLSILGDPIPLQGVPYAGFIADFSQIDFEPIIANRGPGWIWSIKNDGVSGSGETVRQNAFFPELVSGLYTPISTNNIPLGDLRDAVADGRPFAVVRFRTSFASLASDFVADPSELAPFYAVPDPIPAAPGVSTFGLTGGTNERIIRIDGATAFDYMTSVQLYEHFAIPTNQGAEYGQQNILNGNDLFFRVTDPVTGDVLEWDVELLAPIRGSFGFSGQTLLDNFSYDGGNLRLDKVAQPGERGRIAILTGESDRLDTEFNYLPSDILEVFEQSPTQEDLDNFEALFAQYLIDLEEFNAFNALPESPVIRGVFTKTPCIVTGNIVDPGEIPPVDPGPVNDGFPGELVPFIPPVHSLLLAANGFNALNTPTPPGDEEVIVIDFTNWDITGDDTNGRPGPGAGAGTLDDFTAIAVDNTNTNTHGGIRSTAEFVATLKDPSSVPNSRVTRRDVQFALSQGRPFLTVNREVGGDYVALSGFTATLEEQPLFSEINGSVITTSPTAFATVDYSGIAYFENTGSFTNTGPAYVSSAAEADARYTGLLDVSPFDHIALRGLETFVVNQNTYAGQQVTISVTNTAGNTLTYNVTFESHSITSTNNDTLQTFGGAAAVIDIFLLSRQAEPNGEPGELIVRGRAENGFPNVDPLPPSIVSLVSSNVVTQEEVDEFNAALAQFNMERDAFLDATEGLFFTTDELPFNKVHHLPLQEFAIYYCYIRDDEQTPNSNRGMQHWQNFFQLLNKREDTEIFIKAAEEDAE